MLKILLVLFLFLNTLIGSSQDYDLIVTKKGDSIACFIDSISNTHIYFEMKSKGKWIHTYILIDDIKEYEFASIDKREMNDFKAGTSTIISNLTTTEANKKSELNNVFQNSIYLNAYTWAIGPFYERLIPFSKSAAFIVGGGIVEEILFYGPGIDPLLISGFILGRNKHFFELGMNIAFNPELSFLMPAFGYRFQHPNGFLFKLGVEFEKSDGWPGFSIGYSF